MYKVIKSQFGKFLILLIFVLVIISLIVILLVLTIRGISKNNSVQELENSYWTPNVGDTFQWQLSDYPVDLSIEAEVYDVDLFEVPRSTISELHEKGSKVICYVNIGAWEEYRDDASDFPTEVIGNEYEGWEGESWLDISRYELFSDIMKKRFDLAQEKGCDSIEPDNSQGYLEDTGFEISYEDQLKYNTWLASQVHARGMSIGLKNDPDQVEDLIEYYDWALIEECHVGGFCEDFKPFIEAGKPVFQVEYTDTDITLDSFCESAINRSFYGILKQRNLNSWSSVCDE